MTEALSTREQAVLDHLAASQPQMLSLLQRIVDIDSGSYHKQGVDAVIAELRGHLQHHGVACEIHPHAEAGNCMRASVAGPGQAGGADGALRHGIPAGHGGAAAVSHRRRHGLRAWRGRHEGRAGDQLKRLGPRGSGHTEGGRGHAQGEMTAGNAHGVSG